MSMMSEVNLAGGSAPLHGESRDLSLSLQSSNDVDQSQGKRMRSSSGPERVSLTRCCRRITDPDGQGGTFRITAIARHFTANRDPLTVQIELDIDPDDKVNYHLS